MKSLNKWAITACSVAVAGVAAVSFNLLAEAKKSTNPFDIYPFQIPAKYEQEVNGYRNSWSRLTGFEHSGLHWQQFIAIYINQGQNLYRHNYLEYLAHYQDWDDDEDEGEMEAGPNFKAYQPGTVVLKENFAASHGSPDTALTITMMIKRQPGYDSQFGDWEYVQFDAKGNMLLAGNTSDPAVKQNCSNCHVNVAERDYIFANFFSKSP